MGSEMCIRDRAVGEAEAFPRRCIGSFLGRLGQLRQHATKVVLPERILEALRDDAHRRRSCSTSTVVWSVKALKRQAERRLQGPLVGHVQRDLIERRLGQLLGRRTFIRLVVRIVIVATYEPLGDARRLRERLFFLPQALQRRRHE